MCQRKIKKQKLVTGFTLIETIIYTALLVLIVSSAVLATQTALQLRGRTRAELILAEGMRFALIRITDRVQTASEIVSPNIVGEASDTLTLTVPETNQSPVIFTVTDATLTIQEGGSAATPLTPEAIRITALTFVRLQGTPTPVEITINGTSGSGAHRADLTLTALAIPNR